MSAIRRGQRQTPSVRPQGSTSTAQRRSLTVTSALILAATVASAGLADPLLPSLPSSYFPIGVYYQPAHAGNTTSLAGWKARGINTLIGWEQQAGDAHPVSIGDYSAAAVSAGLYMIREPRANPADDVNQANLLAFLQPDEPDVRGIDPAVLQNNYTAWKAAAPNMPVMANFDGSRVIGWQGSSTRTDYQNFMKGADWASDDLYPVTGFINPGALPVVGQAVDKLRSYAADPVTGQTKPGFAIIETSNQRLFADSHPEWNERGVVPGEFREMLWDALIHGANGIVYFPQSFNAFHYDATPVDVAAEMTKQDGIIQSLASVLNSSDTPDVASVTLTGGSLETMVKSYNGVTYLFVLNQSNQKVTGTITGNFTYGENGLAVVGEGRTLFSNAADFSTYQDSFDPFAVHIYAEGPYGAAPLTITALTPEPTSALLLGVAGLAGLVVRRHRRGAGG